MQTRGTNWKLPRRFRLPLLWLGITALAVGTALLLSWMGVNTTAAAMVFLVLVVWSATVSGLALSVWTAVLCALSFDYFFLPPVRTLRLASGQEGVALLAFLASCAVVGRVAELARRQTRQAEQRRADVEQLFELSQQMMLHEDPTGLPRELPRMIHNVFGLDEVALYLLDQDQFFSSAGSLSESQQSYLRSLTQGMNPTFAGPDTVTAMALKLGMRPVGALSWLPARLSREVASSVGAQTAIALTRATAMEASARLEAARESERLRTALIDSLTHELRTPLTSIRAAATTLLEGGEFLDDEGRRDLASIVDEEASRLDALIGEAVEMAEIDANVVQVRPTPQHTRALFDQAVEESRKALGAHRVEYQVEEPDAPAWFDPHLLGRVLRHLLENAARYTPAGGRITLGSRRAGDRLEFCVEDDGPGIDAADLPLIFEKFYRGKAGAAAGKKKGTGMGLAITRAILLAHGGGIEAVRKPGRGAAFRFWIPLVEKDPAQP